MSAEGSDVVTLTVKCHGETETKVIPKGNFTFTQKFFVQPE